MSARDEHMKANLQEANRLSGTEGVSPVVAVILMVAITVVLAAVLYNWALQFMPTDKDTPKCSLRCSYHEDGFFIVEIAECDSSIYVNSIHFYLEDNSGGNLEMGNVHEIYELDMFFSPHNLSFVDKEMDGGVDSGDYFILRSSGNGGLAQRNQKFRLVFIDTDETMGWCRLTKTKEAKNTSLPRTQWNITVLDEQSISLDESQSAASHFSTYAQRRDRGSELLFSLVFEHTGDAPRDLTIALREENTTLTEQHHEAAPGESVIFLFNHTGDVDGEEQLIPKTYYLIVLDSKANETLLSGELGLVFWKYRHFATPSFSTTTTIQLITILTVLFATVARVTKKRLQQRELDLCLLTKSNI